MLPEFQSPQSVYTVSWDLPIWAVCTAVSGWFHLSMHVEPASWEPASDALLLTAHILDLYPDWFCYLNLLAATADALWLPRVVLTIAIVLACVVLNGTLSHVHQVWHYVAIWGLRYCSLCYGQSANPAVPTPSLGGLSLGMFVPLEEGASSRFLA